MKQPFSLLFIGLLLFIGTFSLQGQEQPITFEQVALQDGLGFDGGYCVMQDRKGFIWFGTTNGLHRYDGYSTKAYKYDPKDTSSLASNYIITIWEDGKGNIWIGTNFGGLCRFDPATETFVRYDEQSYLPGLKNRGITSINEDQEGMLWLGTFEGVSRFNPTTGRFTRFEHNPHDPGSIGIHGLVTKIFKDHKGTLWIGSSQGLDRVNMMKGKDDKTATITFTHYLHNPSNSNSLSNNSVWAICEDHQGMLWIGTKGGLNRLDQHTHTFTRFQHDPANAHSIGSNNFLHNGLVEDKQGNLWIGTADGLIKLNPKRTHFTTNFRTNPDGVKAYNNNFMSLMIDKAGTLWAASEGFLKVDLNRPHITHLQHQANKVNSLLHNDVWAIIEDKQGNVWMGTDAGLSGLDPKRGTFVQYPATPNSAEGLAGGFINALLEDREGNIWIGGGRHRSATGAPGFCKFNPKTGKFTRFLEKVAPGGINTMYQDKSGLIWFGTSGDGLRSYNPSLDIWQHYIPNRSNKDALVGTVVNALCEDGQGNLWIGTNEGINKLNPERTKFTHYKYDPTNPRSLSFDRILSLHTDGRGRVWIGTEGGGLCSYDLKRDDFERYTQQEGLLDNSIGSIVEDDQGDLWLGTNKGLCRFSPRKGVFTYVDIGDGFPENQAVEVQVNQRASFKGKGGTLYFGGSNGVKFFHPKELRTNTFVPPVVITEFKLFDKVIPGKHESKQIKLHYDENFFSFEFAALNYTNSQKNQYAYQLEGVDKDWVYSGTRRIASYTDLSPGRYTFRVKGSNNNGIWNEKGASLLIVIDPPIYLTIWAYISYGVLIIAGLWFARKAIVNRERLRANLQVQQVESEKLRELDTLKSRLFANISHEFRTPLSLIKGISEKLQKQTTSQQQKQDYQVLDRNTGRLLELINQLLELSKLEAGKLTLHPQPGELTSLLQSIAGSFESLFESKNIQFRYTLPLQAVWVEMDQEKLRVILTNLLSNAYKFTPAGGKVILSAKLDPVSSLNGKLLLTIEDTGIGISQEHLPFIFNRFYQADTSVTRSYEGTGIGLSLVKELVDLHGGNVSVNSQEGKGSVFNIYLTLPFTQTTPIIEDRQDRVSTSSPEESLTNKAATSEINGAEQIHSSKKENARQVLVVEDNVDLRHFLFENLQPYYQVGLAIDGQDGLEKALEIIPDLIISDVMMPRLDGISLCEKLKEDERTSHIPLILLTAKADLANKLQGLQTGADDYLAKPFSLEELLIRVRNLLDMRKKLQERYSKTLSIEPQQINVTSTDERFLQKALSIVEANIGNSGFDVETFGKQIGMSRSQLHRKLTALTNLPPTDFIRQMRLKRAAHLLQKGHGNVSEVALAVGFSSLNYFTRCFREMFGKTPSEYGREFTRAKA